MKELKLRIISAEQFLFTGEIVSVKLPGVEGDFSILVNHAPLISALTKGKVIYQLSDGSSQTIEILSGFVEVKHNQINVCVEK